MEKKSRYRNKNNSRKKRRIRMKKIRRALLIILGGITGISALVAIYKKYNDNRLNIYYTKDSKEDIFEGEVPVLNEEGMVTFTIPDESIVFSNKGINLEKECENVIIPNGDEEIDGRIQSIYLGFCSTIKKSDLEKYNIILKTNRDIDIKKEPNSESKTLYQIRDGVQILGIQNKENDGKWTSVIYFDKKKCKKGYIDSSTVSAIGTIQFLNKEEKVKIIVNTKGSPLIVREGPGKECKLIDYLENKTILEVTSDNLNDLDKNKGWLKITYNGITGYISAVYANYLETNTPVYSDNVEEQANDKTENDLLPEKSILVKVNTDKDEGRELKLRDGPGTNYNEIDELKNGTDLKVTIDDIFKVMNGENWLEITYNGKTGYVSSEYLVYDYDIEQILNSLPNKIEPYEDIEITDKDIQVAKKCKNSWENQGLFGYLTNKQSNIYTYDNPYVKGYITEDRSQYICYEDGNSNGTKNFGFGVMVNQDGKPNDQTIQYFKELGYDITDKDLKVGESTLPVELVDRVADMYVMDTVKTIQDCLKQKNVKMTKQQILALVEICYQYGRSKITIDKYIDYFIESRGYDEIFREKLTSRTGKKILKQGIGGTVLHNGTEFSRADAYYQIFHYGIFVFGIPEESTYNINEQNNAINYNPENMSTSNIKEPLITTKGRNKTFRGEMKTNNTRYKGDKIDKRNPSVRARQKGYLNKQKNRKQGGFTI